MDDLTDFERQLAGEVRDLMGPVRPVDDAAIFAAVKTRRWRIQSMFSATRFVVAGAVVAVFGGFLLAGLPTHLPADDQPPAASAASSDPPELVYMLDGDIYVAKEDGTDPVRIVDGSADVECGGSWGNRGLVSPDGRHIAYRTEGSDDCPGTIEIVDLEGRRVASVPGVGWDIAWSPDSTRIATWLELFKTIGVYGIDGSLQAELDGSVHSSGDRDPKWTPDGTALLLPTTVETAGISHGLVARLPLDGSEPEVLPVTDPLSIRTVSFSPDGTRAASAGPEWQLAVGPLDGTLGGFEFFPGPDERISAYWSRRPLWSPTGDRIAVVSGRSSTDDAGDPIQESVSLWVVESTPEEGATKVASVEGDGDLDPIAFSPDGEHILVQAHDAGWAPSLWSVATDGSGSTVIVPGAEAGVWVLPVRTQG